MTVQEKFDPELEKLVQEVKQEMIREGRRYVGRPRYMRYKKYSTHGKKIKPEFPGVINGLCPDKPKVDRSRSKWKPPEKNPIQFRGTPGRKKYEP